MPGRSADDDYPVAVLQFGENRICFAELYQRLPRESDVACVEPRILGYPQQLADGNRLVADGVVMQKPLRRKVDPVMTRDERQTLKTSL